MKTPHFLLWFIAILIIVATLIDVPQNIQFAIPWGKTKINRIISAPEININLGPIKYRKSFNTRLGLDLSGGTHLVMEADMAKIAVSDRERAYESARNTIERRINLFGLTEPVIQKAKVGDSYRIIVYIPVISDMSKAIDLIGTTAQLSFREEATLSAQMATPSSVLEVWP